MDLQNALDYELAVRMTIPIEFFPGYRPHTEPIPLHGPDYATYTLRELLYEGQLLLDFEGTPFVDIMKKWNEEGPLVEYLDPENRHVFNMILSWKRIANYTPQDLNLFPKFPLHLKIDRHCNFQINE